MFDYETSVLVEYDGCWVRVQVWSNLVQTVEYEKGI